MVELSDQPEALAGVEHEAYLRHALLAALDGQSIPLPHEVAQAL